MKVRFRRRVCVCVCVCVLPSNRIVSMRRVIAQRGRVNVLQKHAQKTHEIRELRELSSGNNKFE